MISHIILRFHPQEEYFPTCIRPHKETVPAYRSTGKVTHHGKEYTADTFSFYYAQNKGIMGASSPMLGYHEHDIEYITVLRTNEKIHEVFFSAHSSREGSWVQWEDCETTPDGGLIAYVSRNSHAHYPHAGTHWRIFGVANDICSSSGKQVRFPVDQMNRAYSHTFPNGIALTGYPRFPNVRTLSKFQKFILPLI